jgi:serine-type D-Ala-D-Ala carboxypeptidase/endopeptidase
MPAVYHRRSFLLACVVAALPRAGMAAPIVSFSDSAIRKLLAERIDNQKRATGMAVGIVERGRRRVITYGRLDSGDARSTEGSTLFEIGSVTKVFTALLLADMVRRNELGLNDPVQCYLPAPFRVPQYNGRSITLADLATHTSGLPLFPPLRGNPLESIGRYSVDELRSWLADFKLTRDPGTHWEYSNIGYALLGLALAEKTGTDFETLLRRRIIEPLRLNSTVLQPSRDMLQRVAVSHDAKLNAIAPLELGIFAPAGALRSTVQDLLTFVTAVMPNSRSPIEAPAQLLLTIRRPVSPAGWEQALGWDVSGGRDGFIVKDGVSAGQAASVVADPATKTGVVVLSNALPVKLQAPPSGAVGAADLARHLMRPALPLG